MTKDEKDAMLNKRPDLWKSTDGVGYLNALSRVRSINARNLYYLPILERQARDAKDEARLGLVMQCISTYKNIDPVEQGEG